MSASVGTVTDGRHAAAGAAALSLLLLLVGVLTVLAAPAAPEFRVALLRDGDLYVVDAASGAETRLTSDGRAVRVWWAPDGRELFFATGHPVTGTHVWRWRPGGAVEQVSDGLWSPSGDAVALARPLSGSAPGTAAWVEAGGRPARITPEEPWVNWLPVAWSPDGRWLAVSRVQLGPAPVRVGPTYAGPVPGEGSLVLVDRAGGGRRDVRLPREWGLTTKGGWPDAVAWAPTGDRLAVWVGPPDGCASCRADGAPVLVVEARDGHTQPVGTALDRAALSWAPDGSFLVLSVPWGRETYREKHLLRVDLPSGATRELARDPTWADTAPAVSPDGIRVAFARGVALVDGRPARPLPSGLYVTRAAPASRRLWLVDADGGRPRQMTDAPGWADEAPVWTPDGRWIVFVRWRPHPTQGVPGTPPDAPGAAELWAVRPDGTGPRRLGALGLPPGFYGGLGFYGRFAWHELFAVAPGGPSAAAETGTRVDVSPTDG